MVSPPANPRAIAFVDGQNLFHAAKKAFGYSFPNYDVRRLVERICSDQGWTLAQVLRLEAWGSRLPHGLRTCYALSRWPSLRYS